MSAPLGITLAIVGVYSTCLIFPYYFVDDLWLYRPVEAGFPDRATVVAVVQGRPVFAMLALATEHLRTTFGVSAMLMVRAVAVCCLGVFAYCTYRFFSLWQSARTALIMAILLITLPSMQMYVSAAPLFAPSLAICGGIVLLFGRVASGESSTTRTWSLMALSALALVIAWATYQAIPLIVVSLLVPMILSDRWQVTHPWWKLGLFLGAVAASLVTYYALWSMANLDIAADNRYSPKGVGLNLVSNWPTYLQQRLPQSFSFWDTSTHARPYLVYFAVVVIAAVVLDLVASPGARLRTAVNWCLAISAVVAVDVPLLLAPPSNGFSYMTSAPSATATFLLLAVAMVKLVRFVPWQGRRWSADLATVAICAAASAMGARNVAVNHVIPSWMEYALVRSELRRHAETGHISLVKVYVRGSLLGLGRNEFNWSNFGGSFWAHWAVRNILDEIGADSRVRIDVINTDGTVATSAESMRAAELNPPDSGVQVTVDLRAINLATPGGGDFRQPALFPQPRPAARGGFPPIPEGMAGLRVSDIRSTLTFGYLGALGQQASVDGDMATAAADPGGFNRGTTIELHLEAPATVTGLGILTAREYGVALAARLAIVCDIDGVLRPLGEIEVAPGTDVSTVVLFETPCQTRTLRLTPLGAPSESNFWVSEIQVLGRLK
ncbi:MAG: hypothetical protein Q8L86_16450 [Vicinamibacterales bacterium]|nr:hypothetical protein [Vicinamibacterales bacterium]